MPRARKNRKSLEILSDLKRRSERGLEFAKQALLCRQLFPQLREALEYYTSNWENFTHPGLFSVACEAVGGDPEQNVEVQAVIAMIAAALDIHDDIIDESETKHGRQTVFGRYGRDTSIILGDVFLVAGLTLLAEHPSRLAVDKANEVLRILNGSLLELGSAHALELRLKAGKSPSTGDFMSMVEKKAAGIAADMQVGAVVGGGDVEETEALRQYGRILGMLATLREEFIDVFDAEELHSRMQSNFLPLPIMCAMKNEKAKGKICRLLSKERISRRGVEDLVELVFASKGVLNLRGQMGKLADEGVAIACGIENNGAKKCLCELVTSTLEDL